MTPLRLRALVPALALGLFLAPPAPADSIVTTDAFLPAVHIQGATGRYQTDVSIFNPNDTTVQVSIFFTPADADGTNAQQVTLTNGLAARETVTLDDTLAIDFGVTSGYGLYEVLSSQPVIVTSNTYNVAGAAPGTFGQFSPGQPERNSVGFGMTNDYDLYVPGIPNDASHRTNAVVINASDKPLHATVELISGSGARYGSMNVDVPPYSLHQVNDVFGAAFAAAHPYAGNDWRLNFYVNTNTGATLLAYATITDTRSGDPYLVPAQAQVPNVPAFVAPPGATRPAAPQALAAPAGDGPRPRAQTSPSSEPRRR